jgi:hypothetical protein
VRTHDVIDPSSGAPRRLVADLDDGGMLNTHAFLDEQTRIVRVDWYTPASAVPSGPPSSVQHRYALRPPFGDAPAMLREARVTLAAELRRDAAEVADQSLPDRYLADLTARGFVPVPCRRIRVAVDIP